MTKIHWDRMNNLDMHLLLVTLLCNYASFYGLPLPSVAFSIHHFGLLPALPSAFTILAFFLALLKSMGKCICFIYTPLQSIQITEKIPNLFSSPIQEFK